MNLKILGLFGILAIAAYPVWTVVATDDVEEVEEDDEEYDEEYEEEESGEQKVVARMTCDDIKVKISELQSINEPTDDELLELDDLIKKQRNQCTYSGRTRPSARKNISVELQQEELEEETETIIEEKPKKKKKKKSETETEQVKQEPVKTQKQIDAERAANMANGLCGDGTKSNKFGCCEGEKFKDMGNLSFACCPTSGDGECHAPIQK